MDRNILEDDINAQISITKCDTVAAGTDEELPIFVAPFDAFLRKISIVNDVTVAIAGTNYVTISFQRKGSAGSGTDEIASMTTNTGGTALTARVAVDVGALDNVYRYIPKGTAVTYKRVHAGTGKATTNPLFAIEYVRA
jgi:hypothetical protein